MLTNRRCPWVACARRATGRFTSTPRCIIGAVTMKMMSSTSITSTSGTTLISLSDVDTRRPRPRPPPVLAAGWTFGIYKRQCGAGRQIGLGEISLRDIQELHREIVHLRCEQLHPVREMAA